MCHTASPHHQTPAAIGGDCVSCHGDLVDNIDDGHYIPTSPPSDTTPSPRTVTAFRSTAVAMVRAPATIVMTTTVWKRRSSAIPESFTTACLGMGPWIVVCATTIGIDPLNIRSCEGCHGPDSLHSIQADSPAEGNIGTIVVGGELAGYGHVGRNAGPGDSDCWGCHGFALCFRTFSQPLDPDGLQRRPGSRPRRNGHDGRCARCGIHQFGGGTLYESDIRLTAADGSSVILEPDLILDHGTMVVTIPRNTRPGNYNLRAVKAGFASNPAVISVVPWVRISRAVYQGKVTILGTGFGGYAEGSATSVTGTITTGTGRRTTTKTVTANDRFLE